MNQKNLVAVDVFDQGKEPTTPSDNTPVQQPENEENGPGTTDSPTSQNDTTQTTQDVNSNTEKSNDMPSYFIYGAVFIGLFILLALLLILRKIYKK